MKVESIKKSQKISLNIPLTKRVFSEFYDNKIKFKFSEILIRKELVMNQIGI